MEQGAAPAARAAYPANSGGAGAPPGGITTPRQELADGEPQGRPRRKGQAAQKRPAPRAERGRNGSPKARPGAGKTPRWRAERPRAAGNGCVIEPK